MAKGECDGISFDIVPPDYCGTHPDKVANNIDKEKPWAVRGTDLFHHMFSIEQSRVVEKGSAAVADLIGRTAFPNIWEQGLQVIREIVDRYFKVGENLLDEDGNLWFWISIRWLAWWGKYAATINFWEWIAPLEARRHWQLSFFNEGYLQLGSENPVDNIDKGSVCA